MTTLSDEDIVEIDEEKWKLMSPDEVQDEIKGKCCKINRRVRCAIKSGKHNFYKSELNEDEFMLLIWHKIDDSRLLTPEEAPRTVRDVAKRVSEKYDFQQLSQKLGLPPNMHKPKWFRKCRKIEKAFCYDKFYAIWLVMANEDELYKAPSSAQYYIYDGCHRSLVLGKLLLERKKEYRPVKAILIDPKPEED